MKKLAAALFAGLMAASGAAAPVAAQSNAQIDNPGVAIANFDVENLGPILTELGFIWKTETSQSGQTFLAANVGGDLVINFLPSACLEDGKSNCIGLNTLAYFSGASINPQTVSAFNQKYWFASAGVVSGGRSAYISRYDIADFGIPRGNVASSVRNFVFLALRFREEIRSGARTVSLDGYADDMASGALNRAGFKALGGEHTAETTDDHHQAGFEDTPQIVKILLDEPAAPKNKIDNITAK